MSYNEYAKQNRQAYKQLQIAEICAVVCMISILTAMVLLVVSWIKEDAALANQLEAQKMSVWTELKNDLTAAEGRETRVYRDSLGYPTGGIGHRLIGDELDEFPLGTDVSDEQIDVWYLADEKAVRDSIAKYQTSKHTQHLSLIHI